MPTLKRLTIFVLLIALTACSAALVPTPAGSPLAENRQKWEAQHITHYRFSLSVGCFCAFRDKMPLTIEVQDGQVVSMVDKDSQAVTDFKDTFAQYDSIENLFNALDSAQNGGAEKVTAEYNPDHGYPQSIFIDGSTQVADDEMNLSVSSFEILK
jgi:Family of unknown function (DUF6174)